MKRYEMFKNEDIDYIGKILASFLIVHSINHFNK